LFDLRVSQKTDSARFKTLFTPTRISVA